MGADVAERTEMSGEELAAAISSALIPKLEQKIEDRVGGLREGLSAQVLVQLKELGLVTDEGRVKRPPHEQRAGAGSLLSLFKPEAHNPQAVGAMLDGKFSGFGDFLRASLRSGLGRGTDERLKFITEKGEIKADLSGNDLATGGALVPEEFRAELLSIGLAESAIRPLCFRIPMGSSSIRIPAIDDRTHATGTVFGGIQGYWTQPGGNINESQPTFARVGLNAKGLKFYTELENELISDSFTSAEALVVALIGRAEPWFFDQAVIGGSGAGEPLGIRHAAAKVLIDRATNNEIAIADIANMYARMLPSSLGRAVWLISPEALAELMQLQTANTPVFWPDATQGLRMQLGGNRVIVVEHLGQLGAADDIMFVDFGFYLVGDRQALSIATSAHYKFQNELTAVRGVERLDGQPWIQSALTPANGGDTLSPIVSLDA